MAVTYSLLWAWPTGLKPICEQNFILHVRSNTAIKLMLCLVLHSTALHRLSFTQGHFINTHLFFSGGDIKGTQPVFLVLLVLINQFYYYHISHCQQVLFPSCVLLINQSIHQWSEGCSTISLSLWNEEDLNQRNIFKQWWGLLKDTCDVTSVSVVYGYTWGLRDNMAYSNWSLLSYGLRKEDN